MSNKSSKICCNSPFVKPTCLTPTTKVKAKWYLLSLQVPSLLVEFMTIMTLALTSQVHV